MACDSTSKVTRSVLVTDSWESYRSHRKKEKRKQAEILGLTPLDNPLLDLSCQSAFREVMIGSVILDPPDRCVVSWVLHCHSRPLSITASIPVFFSPALAVPSSSNRLVFPQPEQGCSRSFGCGFSLASLAGPWPSIRPHPLGGGGSL